LRNRASEPRKAPAISAVVNERRPDQKPTTGTSGKASVEALAAGAVADSPLDDADGDAAPGTTDDGPAGADAVATSADDGPSGPAVGAQPRRLGASTATSSPSRTRPRR
jgi:hypothetical protein